MAEPVKPGTEAAEIIGEEERVYARVQARVAVGPEETRERVGAEDIDRELIDLRDQIGEAKPEDLAPLVEQMTRLAAVRVRLGGSRSLPVDIGSPYFAHMVLTEDGRRRDVLIGKRGFIDRSSNVQIVDWRNAPISQVYYRYDEGDDYDEEIAGRHLSGVVEVRRNLSIARSILRRIGAPQGTFVRDVRGQWRSAVGEAVPTLQGGQGTAARSPKPPAAVRHGTRRRGRGSERSAEAGLGVHGDSAFRADKHLPEIAALIDREQFDLITRPESGMVVIQGGAGSGKTTVALHRIAFLNFADGNRFRTSRMLVIVPSPALVRYVEGLLPSLGVHGVPVVTYTSWARSTRLRLLRGSGGKYNQNTPEAVSQVKKHPGILPLLAEFVAERVMHSDGELQRAIGGLSGGDAVIARWQELGAEPLVRRLRELRRWTGRSSLGSECRIAVESVVKSLLRREEDIVADWAEALTDRERLRRWLARDSGVSMGAIDATVSWCSAQLEESEEVATDLDGRPIESVDGRTDNRDQIAGRFDTEDDPILLRLIQLKRGALVSRDASEIHYSHIAIDEAQDRSAIEVKVLLEAIDTRDSAGRSVTIAGDTAQRLVFDNSFSGWSELLTQTGNEGVVVSPLRLSYRSTAEVMALAHDILGADLAPEEPLYARSGAPVELHEFGDVGEAVAFLCDALRALSGREPTASVAVIARYPEQADAYYEGLRRAEVPSLRRVRNHDFAFVPGVDVTDVSQVKGLEFDYVIMVDVNASSYPVTVESRHLLHIAATRAAHQLWLVSTSEPAELLPESLRMG